MRPGYGDTEKLDIVAENPEILQGHGEETVTSRGVAGNPERRLLASLNFRRRESDHTSIDNRMFNLFLRVSRV